VRSIAAHDFSAFAAGLACLLGRELMRGSGFMSGLSTFARNHALLVSIH
jgi:hypothetical protein